MNTVCGVTTLEELCSGCAGTGLTSLPPKRKVHVRFVDRTAGQSFDPASFAPLRFDVSKLGFSGDADQKVRELAATCGQNVPRRRE